MTVRQVTPSPPSLTDAGSTGIGSPPKNTASGKCHGIEFVSAESNGNPRNGMNGRRPWPGRRTHCRILAKHAFDQRSASCSCIRFAANCKVPRILPAGLCSGHSVHCISSSPASSRVCCLSGLPFPKRSPPIRWRPPRRPENRRKRRRTPPMRVPHDSIQFAWGNRTMPGHGKQTEKCSTSKTVKTASPTLKGFQCPRSWISMSRVGRRAMAEESAARAAGE